MGKVLTAVAIIGLAVGIAVAAPWLAGFVAAAGTTAFVAASAAITVGLSIAASAAVSALAGKPSTTTAPGRQPSRGQPQREVNFRWTYPPGPSVSTMEPVRPHWLRDRDLYPGQRFALVRCVGDCMGALARGYVVIDREAVLRAGDLIQFEIDDLKDYLRAAGSTRRSSGLVKRFVGVDPVRRVMVFECTFPPQRAETGLDRIKAASRIVATTDGWWAAIKLILRVRRNPEAYEKRLGLGAPPITSVGPA